MIHAWFHKIQKSRKKEDKDRQKLEEICDRLEFKISEKGSIIMEKATGQWEGREQ